MGPVNPYEVIVGDVWRQAASGVRNALTPPLQAFGNLHVERSHRGISGLIARLILLPPEGEAVEATLELRTDPDGVRWVRTFGAMRAESVQTFGDRTYTETAGPFRLTFRVKTDGSSLLHVQVATHIFAARVPTFLGPIVEGRMSEGPDERSWTLAIDIGHCWFGSICRYSGVMHAK